MEEKQKHLEFIQNVILRMNTNSFAIKGWVIVIVSALFALSARDANKLYICISYIPIPAFWILDGFYLSQERQYRSLYDSVRTQEKIDFSMDASIFKLGNNTWLRAIFSRTLIVFYPIIIVLTLIIQIFF